MLVYAREDDLRIGLAAYYVTSQELHDDKESRDYWIFGLMMKKVFSDELLLFLNFEFCWMHAKRVTISYLPVHLPARASMMFTRHVMGLLSIARSKCAFRLTRFLERFY